MNATDTPEAMSETSASHQYVLVSLAALVVILLVLFQWGMGRWSFLPVLIGALGVLMRWRMAGPHRSSFDHRIARLMSPLFTLILLAGLLIASEAMELALPQHYPTRGFSLSDWLLCGAVLAFCAAQYRIQAMTLSIFPQEAGNRRKNRPAAARLPSAPGSAGEAQRRPAPARKARPHYRDPQLITPTEIGWLILVLPIWAFLAQLCWRLVPVGVDSQGLNARAWRGIVLAWLLIMGGLVVAGLLSYAGQRRLGKQEARLFLQDAFWQETGGEQRRLSRWLAWAAIRRRRKEKR